MPLTLVYALVRGEENELKEYFDIFPSIDNPILWAALFFLIVFLFLYISYYHIYFPLLRRQAKKYAEYESNTNKLLLSFSELDPNPIIRINNSGLIISLNKAAKEIFRSIRVNKSTIISYFDLEEEVIEEIIEKDRQYYFTYNIDDKNYEVSCQGISFLNMAQLYFRDTSLKRKYDVQVEKYHQLLRNTGSLLKKAQDKERESISRELHDSVGQNLFLLKMNVNSYKKYLPSGIKENGYEKSISILDSTISTIRNVARNLRPLNLNELDLITVVKTMAHNISEQTGMSYHVHIPERVSELDHDLQHTVYSIIKESLNNIIKYAKAKEFIINVFLNEDSLSLSISDNGAGFIPDKLVNDKYISKGLGIMNMQEMAAHYNGSFQIDSALNEGTNILVTLPITIIKNGSGNISNIS